MSQRDRAVPRRLRWAAPLAAVLVLVTGTATAHAVWQQRQSLAAGVVTTGDLSLATEWLGGWTAWTPPTPGAFRDTPLLQVTGAGQGTTLRWRLTASASIPGISPSDVTTQVYLGGCGGTPLPATGYAPAGGLLPGQSVQLCLRVSVAAGASSQLQGKTITPILTVTADQIVS